MSAFDDEPAPPADWVMTYGDMMSLLLTFFIMLASMSEIKEEQRYQAVADALRQRFGYEMSPDTPLPGPNRAKNSALDMLTSLGRARRADTLKGGEQVQAPVGENSRVRTIRPGDRTILGTPIRFTEDSIALSADDRRALQVLVQEIGGKPQKIEIRGHTSPRPLPPGSPFKSHWDLAYARAVAVMEYMTHLGIDPNRVRISVAAENEPLVSSTDPALLDENSRVEVFILNELASGAQPLSGDETPEAASAPPATPASTAASPSAGLAAPAGGVSASHAGAVERSAPPATSSARGDGLDRTNP